MRRRIDPAAIVRLHDRPLRTWILMMFGPIGSAVLAAPSALAISLGLAVEAFGRTPHF